MPFPKRISVNVSRSARCLRQMQQASDRRLERLQHVPRASCRCAGTMATPGKRAGAFQKWRAGAGGERPATISLASEG
jgi:hypothetical protein